MWYKDEIGSGWELGDKLWSGAKTNFDDWIERGADPDDILNAVEEIFGYEEDPPTLTSINDLLWFEPETIEEFLGLSSEEEEIESACHGKSKKDEKKKPVKSAMPGKEKGIQAIMDEYGCTREEAEEIMNEQIDSGRKPVKSSWDDYDDEPLPFDPADVDTITAEDIREAREAIENNPQSTWYKILYTFDDGDELCLTAGMGEGFDEDTVCAKLAVLPSNSGMSDYSWDFTMPYDKETADVWDTEVSNFDESDLDWFNKEAVNMAQEVSEGKWSKE